MAIVIQVFGPRCATENSLQTRFVLNDESGLHTPSSVAQHAEYKKSNPLIRKYKGKCHVRYKRKLEKFDAARQIQPSLNIRKKK